MTLMYEQHVWAWLRHRVLEDDPQLGRGDKRIIFDDVRLEQGEPMEDMVVILFREVGRPHCLFGFRTLAHEPPPMHSPEWQWQASEDPEGGIPQIHAEIIFVNLQERIEAADMGLPEECNPGSITWVP